MSMTLTHNVTKGQSANETHAGDGTRMEPSIPSPDLTKNLAGTFKLLADETRLRILFLLHQEEMNVLELCTRLGQRQPSVSHHLALLRAAGLIGMRREGKHNFYRICPDRFEEMIGSFFEAVPGHPLRICFDRYELRYAPLEASV